METINISIEGYWREIHKKGLPAYPGIIIVYRSKYEEQAKVIRLLRVLYIEEAYNIRERMEKGDIQNKCSPHLKEGEELCYSAGFLKIEHLTDVKAALVFKNQPEVNTEFKTEYPRQSISIMISGRTQLLETNFTVHQFDKK